MNKTASGSPITLTVVHAYNDEALELTGLNFTVFDTTGAALSTKKAATVGSNGQTDITIEGALNETTQKFDVRSVEFELVTASGTYKLTEFYEIEGDVLKLTPFVDSFMTYPESMLVKRRISAPTPYYDSLEDAERAVALENAYNRLTALRFKLLPSGTHSLLDLTPLQVLVLDPNFLDALKKSQIIEANHLVEVNPVRDKIRSGIISETIGESSMFFRQSGVDVRSVYPGVSDDAYPLLSKYLFRETSNAQIWKLRRS